MSAITGIFYRNGRSVDEKQIKKMNDRLSHRGPDGSAIWYEGQVALGHQMLHTTPESLHEKLPFEEGGLIITADARIDNRRELSEKLEIEDIEEVSDSYFILKSYQKWGEKCPEELLGDFAFAIWDKNEEKLFCARDHMGVKPFYYYLGDEVFYFGTEIKAIFSNSEIPRRLNETMVGDYFLYQFNEKNITFYEDISRLPNGHCMTISFDKVNIHCYWKLNLQHEVKFDSDEEYVNKFREIFFEAVKCRLRSKYQVGSLLSGGLDSSSIVCTAKAIGGKNSNLKTFSAVFDEVTECDERSYIKEVLSKTQFDSYFIHADQISPLRNYKEFFWHFDQPFYAPNLFMHWKLFEKAHKNGVRVLLDGFDGDTTLSASNRYLADLLVKMDIRRLVRELRILNKISNKSLTDLIIGNLLAPLTPESLKKFLFTKKRFVLLKWQRFDRFDFINKNFIERMGIVERYERLLENNLVRANNSKEYHYHHLNSGSLQFILELANSVGGAFNIDVRYPFFDQRLIEYSLALPLEQKYYNGYDRIIMRRAMENILPSKVQWRLQKSNLALNFNRGLILFEKTLISKLMESDWSIVKDYVNVNYLNKPVEDVDSNSDHLIKIWRSLTLALWLQEINLEV